MGSDRYIVLWDTEQGLWQVADTYSERTIVAAHESEFAAEMDAGERNLQAFLARIEMELRHVDR